MKISYRTHSAIRIVETGDLQYCMVNDNDRYVLNRMNLKSIFAKASCLFKDIRIITKPFAEAMDMAVGKLFASGISDMEYSANGTYCYKRSDGIIETFCYDFHINGGVFDKLLLFYFQDDTLIQYCNTVTGDNYTCSGLVEVSGNHPGARMENQIRWVFDFFLFIKFSELQVRELAPGQRIKGVSCKYANDTSSNIKILDSTWFTTLVKSDAFKVRGHFRLQPKKKNGEWTKELIWINDFMKDGYTAPARKINAVA